MIQETAYAKINLTLSVTGKREDGYHDIDSVMHSISLHDSITLEKGDGISLSILKGTAPAGNDNLMVKAAALFLEKKGISGGVRMTLSKEIPSEAGMGGGSSDAAAVLRGMAALYDTKDSLSSLSSLGASLGADVPFCVRGGAARCQGIGEKLSPLPAWKGLPLLIVRPQTSVSTGKAYALIDGLAVHPQNRTDLCAEGLKSRNLSRLLSSLSNDFEEALFPVNPLLKETASVLHGLGRPALMTGSGSAFFMILQNREEALSFRQLLKEAYPLWFVEPAETTGGVSEMH